jgi:hypothetical protein
MSEVQRQVTVTNHPIGATFAEGYIAGQQMARAGFDALWVHEPVACANDTQLAEMVLDPRRAVFMREPGEWSRLQYVRQMLQAAEDTLHDTFWSGNDPAHGDSYLLGNRVFERLVVSPPFTQSLRLYGVAITPVEAAPLLAATAPAAVGALHAMHALGREAKIIGAHIQGPAQQISVGLARLQGQYLRDFVQLGRSGAACDRVFDTLNATGAAARELLQHREFEQNFTTAANASRARNAVLTTTLSTQVLAATDRFRRVAVASGYRVEGALPPCDMVSSQLSQAIERDSLEPIQLPWPGQSKTKLGRVAYVLQSKAGELDTGWYTTFLPRLREHQVADPLADQAWQHMVAIQEQGYGRRMSIMGGPMEQQTVATYYQDALWQRCRTVFPWLPAQRQPLDGFTNRGS